MGMLGRLPQSMTTQKAPPKLDLVATLDKVTGTGSLAVPRDCLAIIMMWGGGGAGNGGATGGNGGGALFKSTYISRGTIDWSVGVGATSSGTAGTASTVTLPGGRVLTAQGGSQGGVSTRASGIGGDLHRRGGLGSAASGSGSGEAGEFGGAGGANNASGGGGGGGAGFSDKNAMYIGGAGGIYNNGAGSAPGGGGGAVSGNGGDGRIIVILMRAL